MGTMAPVKIFGYRAFYRVTKYREMCAAACSQINGLLCDEMAGNHPVFRIALESPNLGAPLDMGTDVFPAEHFLEDGAKRCPARLGKVIEEKAFARRHQHAVCRATISRSQFDVCRVPLLEV